MKKVNLFGKEISAGLLSVILLSTLVSAGVLTYYARIQGIITVNPTLSVSMDGENWQAADECNLGFSEEMQGGDVNTLDTNIYVKNNAGREVFVNYAVVLPKDLVDGSNTIKISYVETIDGEVVTDGRYGIQLQDTLTIDVDSNTITSDTTGNSWNNTLVCDEESGTCTFDFASVIEPSIIYGNAIVRIYDITFDLKPEVSSGNYPIELDILPVQDGE